MYCLSTVRIVIQLFSVKIIMLRIMFSLWILLYWLHPPSIIWLDRHVFVTCSIFYHSFTITYYIQISYYSCALYSIYWNTYILKKNCWVDIYWHSYNNAEWYFNTVVQMFWRDSFGSLAATRYCNIQTDTTRPADRLSDAPQVDLPTTSTDCTASYLGYSKDKWINFEQPLKLSELFSELQL